jgi:uncharacterized membrane protein
MTSGMNRRRYLDLVRGIAVLIMIEAHVIDSWTRAADRADPWFGRSLILGGFGAPLFLFLAGVAVSLSAGSKARRTGDDASASGAVQKRGLEIFFLAFVFRFQALIISLSPARSLLRVDILNIMGPAIAATAWLWGSVRSRRARLVVLGSAAVILALITPIVRALAWLHFLPDFIEAYIHPVPYLTNFAVFPWAAFVPAGAVAGVLIDDARDRVRETRLNIAFGAGGAALALGAYGASFLPSPYPHSNFWTTSPSFFFLRLGLLVSAVAAAYLWEQRRDAHQKWSPLRTLGRSSLFIYWIHVEMVYGLISIPLHGSLSLGQAWIALFLFWLLILLLTIAKDRTVRWWRLRKAGLKSEFGQSAANIGTGTA